MPYVSRPFTLVSNLNDLTRAEQDHPHRSNALYVMQNVGRSLNELCPAEFHGCVVVEGLGAKLKTRSGLPIHCPLSAKAGHEHIAGSVDGVVSLSRIRSSEYNGPAMGVHTHSTRR